MEPDGLHVHVEEAPIGDGPYRSMALARTVVDVDVVAPWMQVRPHHLVIFGVVAAGALWLAASGAWPLGILLAGLVGVVAMLTGNERRTARLFVLEDDHLRLGSGPILSFAEVERVDTNMEVVGSYPTRVEIHEVVVTTPAGPLVVATVASAEQAHHVQELIEDALSAYQRRLR